jgi:type II secretion system protein H
MNSQPDIVHKEAGFTLIEVLCVLVLIGLFSSMVVVNMPSQKTPTRIQAENFVKAVNGLAQEGLISGEIRALGISQSEYAFYTYDGTDFEILAQTAWNDEVSPSFSIRDNRIALPEDLSAQIIFEPTGLNTEFRLSLSGRKDSFDIVSTGDGRAELVQTE